jgi:large subunit ribosomal protein L32
MPGPKSRVSRSRRGMRRAHDFATPQTVVSCSNCGALVKPHHVCPSCGYYNGKQVVVAKTQSE